GTQRQWRVEQVTTGESGNNWCWRRKNCASHSSTLDPETYSRRSFSVWRSTVAREAPSNEQDPQPSPSPGAHLLRSISTGHLNRVTSLQHVRIKHGPRPVLIPSTRTTLRPPRDDNLDSRPGFTLGPDGSLALCALQPPTRAYDHNPHSILPCTHFYYRADRYLPGWTGRGLIIHEPRRLQPRPCRKGPPTTE